MNVGQGQYDSEMPIYAESFDVCSTDDDTTDLNNTNTRKKNDVLLS